MLEEEVTKGIEGKPAAKKKPHRVRSVFKIIGVSILLLIFIALLVNALLTAFKPHYYPTFGKYRLFSIVSDSMEPTVPTGSMIVDRVPASEDEITEGVVITFEVTDKDGKVVELLTHRVVKVNVDPETGSVYYTTKGDSPDVREDSIHPEYSDIVGIYINKKCGFFGYFFGFLQSYQGIITMLIVLFIIVVAWIILAYVKAVEKRRELENAALKKSAQQLGNVNLRYDNIREITAVMDVLGMVTEEPKKRAEAKDIELRLGEFVEAESIELPKTPETAAVLDSLPAPDTPTTLAAALRSGATLRQAEDGQTLILTGLSGGKSILLTPVQTPDGIILCQQGVRLRSDLAPNIESMGAMSMPEYPEFFEGQPLEKNVEYPELPQPDKKVFGPGMLSAHGEESPDAEGKPALSAPTPVGQSKLTAIEHIDEAPVRIAARRDDDARTAYLQYRELAAQIELRQVEELSTLLNETVPLSPEEKSRIAEYKNARKKEKPVKKKQPLSPEKLQARREATAKRKEEHEAFLAALSPADRELYLSEQKLSKARAATIRKLKRINSDRKLLDKID